MNKRWSKEEVESIKEYAYHGMSIKEISERMNRSHSSIQNKLRILKNKNEIENKYLNTGEVSEYLGVVKQSVYKYINRNLICPVKIIKVGDNKINYLFDEDDIIKFKKDYRINHNPKPQYTEKEDNIIKDMYYKDYSYADISKVVGRTKDAINIRCLKLYGSRHKKCKSKLKEVLVNE